MVLARSAWDEAPPMAWVTSIFIAFWREIPNIVRTNPVRFLYDHPRIRDAQGRIVWRQYLPRLIGVVAMISPTPVSRSRSTAFLTR